MEMIEQDFCFMHIIHSGSKRQALARELAVADRFRNRYTISGRLHRQARLAD